MAASRKTIDVLDITKTEGLKVLEAHFPPGTSAWAFWDALVTKALGEFKAGKSEILGVTAKVKGSGAIGAAKPETVGANGHG